VPLFQPPSETHREDLERRQWAAESSEASGRGARTQAQRDRDRILYSSAFQRLAYVTQVAAPESGYTFHNRLSHSLKVAQVGRRNTERLQGQVESGEISGAAARLAELIDPDAVEAGCLAHDLGHPPFGHIAESVLHAESCEKVGGDFDGFEGNAQSFRIVTRLAVRRGEEQGLNLTRETLSGLLKYPWPHSTDPARKASRKWGYYADDSEAFAFARPDLSGAAADPGKSLEAEIMDWADDLTYAVHDVDDFFRARLIPLHRLGGQDPAELTNLRALLAAAREAESRSFSNYELDELVEAVKHPLSIHGPNVAYEHTKASRATMREFGSNLITRYLEAFKLDDDPGSGLVRLEIDADAHREVEALKALVAVYVIRRPGLAVVQHGQERVVRDLFRWYFTASATGKSGDRRLFPPGAKERLDRSNGSPEERARTVIDLISGLTETTAVQLHNRLSGGWAGQTLDAVADIG
jgi:dGTPase